LERGYIAINPAFDKLITSLRTAVAEENTLDKESTSHPDIFDAYRLTLKDYKFIIKEIEDKEIKTVTAKAMPNITTRVGHIVFPMATFMKKNTWNVTFVISTSHSLT